MAEARVEDGAGSVAVLSAGRMRHEEQCPSDLRGDTKGDCARAGSLKVTQRAQDHRSARSRVDLGGDMQLGNGRRTCSLRLHLRRNRV